MNRNLVHTVGCFSVMPFKGKFKMSSELFSRIFHFSSPLAFESALPSCLYSLKVICRHHNVHKQYRGLRYEKMVQFLLKTCARGQKDNFLIHLSKGWVQFYCPKLALLLQKNCTFFNIFCLLLCSS